MNLNKLPNRKYREIPISHKRLNKLKRFALICFYVGIKRNVEVIFNKVLSLTLLNSEEGPTKCRFLRK